MPIPSLHARFVQDHFKLVSLCFNLSHELESYEGSPRDYGILVEEILGQQATEILPCLLGLATDRDAVLPYVGLSSGSTVDLYLQAFDEGYTVFLVDSSRQMKGQQEVQQLVNEVGLLNRKLEALTVELTEKNNELDQANKTKTHFIAGMSHELRTPIVSILGHAAWIEKNLPQSQQPDRSLDSVRRSATYLLVLIDNLLQQGNIASDGLFLRSKAVDAAEFFANMVDIMQPLAEEKGLSIQPAIDLPPDYRMWVDAHYFRQALLNLLSNAIKFTDEGSVLLAASLENDVLRVKVADTGIGVAQDGDNDIFATFSRGNNVQGRSGLGIGLSIARDIILAMEGRIEIRSELGEGTEISLQVPQPVADPDAENSASSPAVLAGSRRVLLVEDCSDIATLYALFFRSAGFEFHVIQNPDDFDNTLSEWAPDLILVDYHLGASDGLTLVEAARKQGYEGYIMMLTASTGIDEGLHRRALATGCNEFLNKTDDVGQLITRIKTLFSDNG